MRVPRFYTGQPLSPQQTVTLEEAPSHHLIRVLRAQCGSKVVLFNGDGFEYQAEIHSVEGKYARLSITAATRPTRESPLAIRLGQGISRGERMDLVMQKSVELGVVEITPLWTQRSQVQLSGKRLEKRLSHWKGISTSACEQSGRVNPATICPATGLSDWLKQPAAAATQIILDPTAELTLNDLAAAREVRVLIGPEGGLEPGEIENAVAAGFQPIRLGPRTLRTETAALAILAAMQTLWGDFRA